MNKELEKRMRRQAAEYSDTWMDSDDTIATEVAYSGFSIGAYWLYEQLKNELCYYIEGALSVCENKDRKDFGEMVLNHIKTRL